MRLLLVFLTTRPGFSGTVYADFAVRGYAHFSSELGSRGSGREVYSVPSKFTQTGNATGRAGFASPTPKSRFRPIPRTRPS